VKLQVWCVVQALEQHRSHQDALHQQLQAQRTQLLAAGNSQLVLPKQHSSAGAFTALAASEPQLQPVLTQPPARQDSRMPALPSLPSAILTASGGGYPVQTAGAQPGALKTAIAAEQQKQALPWLPSVLPCSKVQQDSLLPHNGMMHSSEQQLWPALPPLLPLSMAEGLGGGVFAGVCQAVDGTGGLIDGVTPGAAGVSSLDTSDVVPQLLQHGSYAHFKEQVDARSAHCKMSTVKSIRPDHQPAACRQLLNLCMLMGAAVQRGISPLRFSPWLAGAPCNQQRVYHSGLEPLPGLGVTTPQPSMQSPRPKADL
jgi:hypothetical protein